MQWEKISYLGLGKFWANLPYFVTGRGNHPSPPEFFFVILGKKKTIEKGQMTEYQNLSVVMWR